MIAIQDFQGFCFGQNSISRRYKNSILKRKYYFLLTPIFGKANTPPRSAGKNEGVGWVQVGLKGHIGVL